MRDFKRIKAWQRAHALAMFARFLDVSIKSANETESRLLTARDLELIALDRWQKYSGETVEVRKMIYAYKNKVLEDEP